MDKPEAVRTLLIATKDEQGVLRNFCQPLGDIEVVEYTDGEVRMILPHEIPELPECNSHVMIAVTDDPTTDKAYDYSSLGHAHLRLTLEHGHHEKYPDKAVFVSHIKYWKNQVTVPER